MKRVSDQSIENNEPPFKKMRIDAFEYALQNVQEFSLAKDLSFFKKDGLKELIKRGDEEFKVPNSNNVELIKFRDRDIELRVYKENFKEAIKVIESQSFPISKIWLNTCEENCDGFDELFALLLKAIEYNRAITSLQIYDDEEYFSESEAFGKWLKTNTSLTSLAINEAHQNHEEAIMLARGLKENSTLNSLSLFDSELDDDGINFIMEGLAGKTNLNYLNLGLNHSTSEGNADIVELANTLPNLTHLDLSYSELDDYGAATRIKNILEDNKSLRIFNLQESVQDQAAEIIAEALFKNIHLTSLNINASPFVKLGIDQLLLRNQKIFNKMISIIKEPVKVIKEITETILAEEVIKSDATGKVIKKIAKEITECDKAINNITPPYYKFFYETPRIAFCQELGPYHPEILSNFEDSIYRMFSYLSGISKNICPLPLLAEIWTNHIVAPYLRLEDILCHRKEDTPNTSELSVLGDHSKSDIMIAFDV